MSKVVPKMMIKGSENVYDNNEGRKEGDQVCVCVCV